MSTRAAALPVAVGEQQEPVARPQLQRLGRVGPGLDAQRELVDELERDGSAVPYQIRMRMPGVNQLGRTVAETDADQLTGDELVGPRVSGEVPVCNVSLFRW